jgi:uncharacterized SAM-dependent methyltransferase
MNTNISSLALACEETETDLQQLRDEVLSGLSETPKTLPWKLHFDERGSMLFDCLCTLPERHAERSPKRWDSIRCRSEKSLDVPNTA